MKQVIQKRKPDTQAVRELEVIHHQLLKLYDEFTETTAWTALVCDGICGVLGESPTDIDPHTHTGMRYAAIWIKQRNQSHASLLEAACNKLRNFRQLT